MTMSVVDLAWMAAVIDLRGKIYQKNNASRATPQLVLMVESKLFPVIRKLSALTGTNPEFSAGRPTPEWMRKGCIEHCPDKHVHYRANLPPRARWTITGAGAAVVLYNILPYTVNTDEPWRDLMYVMFDNAALEGQGSGATIKALRRLKEIGWDMPEAFEKALEVAVDSRTDSV